MPRSQNSSPQSTPPRRTPALPLTLLDQGNEDVSDEDAYIVVGEAGEDVAFEICEDLEIALGVRDAMQEDGFAVRVFQAVELEIVEDDEPSPGGGSRSA